MNSSVESQRGFYYLPPLKLGIILLLQKPLEILTPKLLPLKPPTLPEINIFTPENQGLEDNPFL